MQNSKELIFKKEALFKLEKKANTPFAKLMRNKLATLGFIIIIIIALMAIFAPFIATHDPNEMKFSQAFKKPGEDGYLFGTDEFGRDLFSRIVYGARISMIVGLGATFVGAFFGSVLGLIAGYGNKIQDSIIMRTMDGISAFPFILLAVFLMTIFGNTGGGLLNVVLAISIGNIPRFARVSRGETLMLKREEFVNAESILGASHFRILFIHILPNAVSAIIVNMTLYISTAILAEAALGFLGMGVMTPTATWGDTLRSGRNYLNSSPHIAIISGVFIMITVLGFNLFGDGIRDIFDPKMKK